MFRIGSLDEVVTRWPETVIKLEKLQGQDLDGLLSGFRGSPLVWGRWPLLSVLPWG